MLRIIRAMLRDNATYDPYRYAQVLKAEGFLGSVFAFLKPVST